MDMHDITDLAGDEPVARVARGTRDNLNYMRVTWYITYTMR